jgi:2-polyprenyl-3-methyl-5-hydroxy-6-metoxy-1,4-benzoquinol methylase
LKVQMNQWRDISADPNDPALLNFRREAITKARAGKSIKDRVAYLSALVRNKSILDIGIVEHTPDAHKSPGWLHRHLCNSAAKCLGVDILEADVTALRASGYNVVVHDIVRQPLPQKFDVIVGGEVLEHLDAPGRFMQNCADMLVPGGKLVITVPNPWYVNAVVKNLRASTAFVDSSDHVAWYDPSTLIELGERHGLELEKFTGIMVGDPQTWRAKIAFAFIPLLIAMGAAQNLFAKSVIYEFVRT